MVGFELGARFSTGQNRVPSSEQTDEEDDVERHQYDGSLSIHFSAASVPRREGKLSPSKFLHLSFVLFSADCTCSVFCVPVQKIVHALELAGRLMDELASGAGPRIDLVVTQCQEFMQSVKVPLPLPRFSICIM